MPYITNLSINCERTRPFPYDIPAIKFAQEVDLSSDITFFVGDNGTGKSTLLETIAYKLGLATMSGDGYNRNDFKAARTLSPHLNLTRGMDRDRGFFFRAEDFSEYLSSVRQSDANARRNLQDLEGEVPESVIQQMQRSANLRRVNMQNRFGQDLHAFSHGEAYLQILEQRVTARGIFIFDEPEAALSPAKQLSLIYFIREHLSNLNSQFIIATHSPILMAMPGARLYEITAEAMVETNFEDTDHYTITKTFLNNPELFLREL